jgi:hypothetical protein
MDERYLEGNLLIYPLQAEPSDSVQRHKMNVHTLCHAISQNEGDRNANFEKLEQITSGKEGVDFLTLFSSSIRFRIEPNGITKLKYNSPSNDVNDRSRFVIARQSFYYLKYSIHAHTHHVAKQDSLTTITPIYDKADVPSAGLRLVCQLKRELTSLKRTQQIDEVEHPTNNAVGIIAYIKSLICSLEGDGIIKSSIAKREQSRFDYVESSFKAQNCKISSKINNIEQIKSKSKVWLGFVIISIWGILNFKFKPVNGSYYEIPEEWFLVFVSTLFVTVFAIYFAIKKFYTNRYVPDAAEHLYNISSKLLGLKIVLPLIGIILLLAAFLHVNNLIEPIKAYFHSP